MWGALGESGRCAEYLDLWTDKIANFSEEQRAITVSEKWLNLFMCITNL